MSQRNRVQIRVFREVWNIAHTLSEVYGDKTHNNKLNPLNELLFIICSVQTNEKLYRSTYKSLKAQFPKFRQLADATENEIAAIIAHGGLSRQKAQRIHAILDEL